MFSEKGVLSKCPPHWFVILDAVLCALKCIFVLIDNILCMAHQYHFIFRYNMALIEY